MTPEPQKEFVEKFYAEHERITTDMDIVHERWIKRKIDMDKKDENEVRAARKLFVRPSYLR